MSQVTRDVTNPVTRDVTNPRVMARQNGRNCRHVAIANVTRQALPSNEELMRCQRMLWEENFAREAPLLPSRVIEWTCDTAAYESDVSRCLQERVPGCVGVAMPRGAALELRSVGITIDWMRLGCDAASPGFAFFSRAHCCAAFRHRGDFYLVRQSTAARCTEAEALRTGSTAHGVALLIPHAAARRAADELRSTLRDFLAGYLAANTACAHCVDRHVSAARAAHAGRDFAFLPEDAAHLASLLLRRGPCDDVWLRVALLVLRIRVLTRTASTAQAEAWASVAPRAEVLHRHHAGDGELMDIAAALLSAADAM